MLTAFPRQCPCGRMLVLRVADQQIAECDGCDATHVAVLVTGVCPKCERQIDEAVQFNVTPDAAEADVE